MIITLNNSTADRKATYTTRKIKALLIHTFYFLLTLSTWYKKAASPLNKAAGALMFTGAPLWHYTELPHIYNTSKIACEKRTFPQGDKQITPHRKEQKASFTMCREFVGKQHHSSTLQNEIGTFVVTFFSFTQYWVCYKNKWVGPT